MSDWKQGEKTAQPALNLVASPDVEDFAEVGSDGGDAGPELFFGYDCHKAEIAGNSSEFPGCSETPETIETSETPEISELPEPPELPELLEMTAPVSEVPAANLSPVAASSVPEVAVPSGAVSLGVVSSGAVPPDLGERYQVLSLLGEGGMGTVWKVFDRDLQETFAVKVLRPELVADETLSKRFEKEAKLACELTHANIAAIFGPCFDKQGHPGIIMRYVDGESLAELLAREGKLSVERTTFILRQLCDALAHSHMKGIVHRDIKPSNIIIAKTEDGSDLVQLVDFGIAQSVYTKATATQALTRSVDVLGSPSYMSPEQFLGKEITAKSDIYSLGCVVYEMLTGAPPFVDENPVRLVLKHLNEVPDLLKVPESMRSVVRYCLAKEASGRVQDVSRLGDLHDLELLGNHGELQRLPLVFAIACLLLATCFKAPLECFAFAFFLLLIAELPLMSQQSGALRTRFSCELRFALVAASLCSVVYASCLVYSAPPWHGLAYLVSFPLLIYLISNRQIQCAFEKIESFSIVNVRSLHFEAYCAKFFPIIFQGLALLLACICGSESLLPLYNIFLNSDFGYLFQIHQFVVAISSEKLVAAVVILGLGAIFCRKKLAIDIFAKRFALLSLAYFLGVLATVASVSLAWQPGMEQMLRQNYVRFYGVSEEKKKEVRLEVLKYPSGAFYNRARLGAFYNTYSDDQLKWRLSVLGQIIDDKLESEKATLAQAYYQRYFLMADLGEKWSKRRSDFDLALSNIAGVLDDDAAIHAQPSRVGILAKLPGRDEQGLRVLARNYLRPLAYSIDYPADWLCRDAYELASSALSNEDIERAKKALAISRAWSKASNGTLKESIEKLEARIHRVES